MAPTPPLFNDFNYTVIIITIINTVTQFKIERERGDPVGHLCVCVAFQIEKKSSDSPLHFNHPFLLLLLLTQWPRYVYNTKFVCWASKSTPENGRVVKMASSSSSCVRELSHLEDEKEMLILLVSRSCCLNARRISFPRGPKVFLSFFPYCRQREL